MPQPTITARHCLLLHCGITNQLFDCFLIEEPTLPLNQYVSVLTFAVAVLQELSFDHRLACARSTAWLAST